MIVTDKQYSMDEKLIKKLDLMADRCTGKNKFDNVILVDGDEGYGKTNISLACAYYLSKKIGRPFSVANVFFDPDSFIKFASKTEEQIIVFDEAAMIALASDWQSKLQKLMVKFLMAARKKRHIYFFNIPKFFRLNEYLVVDRSIALIHVYARRERELGRFVYFKKENKNNLYYHIKRTKKRGYKEFYSFHGTFPEVLKVVIDEEEYDKKKDEAIARLTDDDTPKSKRDQFNVKLRYRISQIPKKSDIKVRQLCEWLGIDGTTVTNWANLKSKYPEIIPVS